MASQRPERPVRALPRLSAVSLRLSSKQFQCLSGWTQIVPAPWASNVGFFLSPLVFPFGDQCCDAMPCTSSESSSSLWAPLPCQATDQMWYLLCLPVNLPVHSHWLWHAHGSRSIEAFAAEDYAWLCARQDSPFQTPPFAAGSLSLWEWWHVLSVDHAVGGWGGGGGGLAILLHVWLLLTPWLDRRSRTRRVFFGRVDFSVCVCVCVRARARAYVSSSSSSSYARWRCLLPSRRRLSSSAPPGCHTACPSEASGPAKCPAL